MHITLPHGTFQRHSTESSVYGHDAWIWEPTAKAGWKHGNKGEHPLRASSALQSGSLFRKGGHILSETLFCLISSPGVFFIPQVNSQNFFIEVYISVLLRHLCHRPASIVSRHVQKYSYSRTLQLSVVCAYEGPQLRTMRQTICDNIKSLISCFFSGVFFPLLALFLYDPHQDNCTSHWTGDFSKPEDFLSSCLLRPPLF